jgi:hypothetical protein
LPASGDAAGGADAPGLLVAGVVGTLLSQPPAIAAAHSIDPTSVKLRPFARGERLRFIAIELRLLGGLPNRTATTDLPSDKSAEPTRFDG